LLVFLFFNISQGSVATHLRVSCLLFVSRCSISCDQSVHP